MTLADLDHVLSAPRRLGIMAMLDAAKRVEFSFLREHLDLSASDLSKQMSVLAENGYVQVRKDGHGPGSTTWFTITPTGRQAFNSHVDGSATAPRGACASPRACAGPPRRWTSARAFTTRRVRQPTSVRHSTSTVESDTGCAPESAICTPATPG
jgi:DNA-binding MarR family transcriptional regulator